MDKNPGSSVPSALVQLIVICEVCLFIIIGGIMCGFLLGEDRHCRPRMFEKRCQWFHL